MKQLREQIRKEIKTLMESRYPAPPEVLNALKVDLGSKEYFIGDGDERNYAIKHINRLLTQPIFTTGEEETEPTGDTGEGGDTSDAGEETADSDVTMEPEDEIPEDEQTT